PLEETMGALAQAVRSGKALYAGISNYSPEQTRQAASLLAELGTPLLIHQPSYSMFNRHIEDGLLEVVDELGVGLAAFSPLQQGLLTNRYLSGVPQSSRAAGSSGSLSQRQVEDPDYQARVRGLSAIAHERGQSLAQLALAWALRHPQVSTALVGASSVHQLEQNVGTLENLELTDEELARLDEFASDGTGRGPPPGTRDRPGNAGRRVRARGTAPRERGTARAGMQMCAGHRCEIIASVPSAQSSPHGPSGRARAGVAPRGPGPGGVSAGVL